MKRKFWFSWDWCCVFLVSNHQECQSRPKEAKKWIKSWKFLILKCTFRVLGNDLTLAFTKLSIISKNKNSSSSEFACPKRFVLLSCETMQNLLTGFAATTSIPRGEQEFFPHLALTFWVNPFFTWPWAKSPWFQFFRRVFGGVIRALASKTITTFWKDLFDSSKQFNFPFCDLFYYRLEPYLDLVFKKVDLKKTKRSKWWPPWTFFSCKKIVLMKDWNQLGNWQIVISEKRKIFNFLFQIGSICSWRKREKVKVFSRVGQELKKVYLQ